MPRETLKKGASNMLSLIQKQYAIAVSHVSYALALQLNIWFGVGRRYQHQPAVEARERALKYAREAYTNRRQHHGL